MSIYKHRKHLIREFPGVPLFEYADGLTNHDIMRDRRKAKARAKARAFRFRGSETYSLVKAPKSPTCSNPGETRSETGETL